MKYKVGDKVRLKKFPLHIKTIESVEGNRVNYKEGGWDFKKSIELVQTFEESPKFKVGDKVRIVGTGYSFDGRVGTISKCDDIPSLYYIVVPNCDSPKHPWPVNEKHLEPVEETPKFKVGDRVRINKCTQGRHTGMIGVVSRPEGCTPNTDNHVCLKNEEGNTLCCYSFPEDLELIESPEREEVKEEKEGLEYRGVPIVTEYPSVHLITFGDGIGPYDLLESDTNWLLRPGKGVTFTIPSPKKVMASLKTIASKLLDADIKALVKAGWLDEELELTEEGEQAVLAHVLLANKVELAKEARKLIKAKKNCEEEE